MNTDRQSADEYLESYFTRLKGDSQQYAREQWLFLTGRRPKPNPENLDITYGAGEQIRIRLAQSIQLLLRLPLWSIGLSGSRLFFAHNG